MYGLMILIGILSSLFLAERLARKRNLDQKIFWEVSFWTIILGLIGARAWHVIDLWDLYSNNPLASLFIWNGGMSIFGALLLGIPTAAVLLRSKNQNALGWLDIFAVVAPLGQAVGRWGNYFNKELLPFAIYESLADLVLFALLMFLYSRKPKAGIITTCYLVAYILIRIVLQPFRVDAIINL